MARKEQESPKAEMTPMIDVVFQLMIFFIVTIKQEDIFSKLNALVPSPNPDKSQNKEENTTSIEIQVGLTPDKKDAFAFNKVRVDLKRLDEIIKTTAATRPEEQVLVCCDVDSHHGALIQVLDICHKYKMKNLSIMSMGE